MDVAAKQPVKRVTAYCCVPQCKNYARDGLSFHCFPSAPKLRERWERALKLRKPSSKYMRVCSDHFKSSDYFPGENKLKHNLKHGTIPSECLPHDSCEETELPGDETWKGQSLPAAQSNNLKAKEKTGALSEEQPQSGAVYWTDQSSAESISPSSNEDGLPVTTILTVDDATSADEDSVKLDSDQQSMKRVTLYCCVPQCKNYARDGLSFHYFPSEAKLREEWEAALRLGKQSSNYMRVCSDHFKSSDYFPGQNKSKCRLKHSVVPSQRLPLLSPPEHEDCAGSDNINSGKGGKRKSSIVTQGGSPAVRQKIESFSVKTSFPKSGPAFKERPASPTRVAEYVTSFLTIDESTQTDIEPIKCDSEGQTDSPLKTDCEAQTDHAKVKDYETQTDLRPIMNILTDKAKLYTYTGLHSFELLDSITECLRDLDKLSITNKKLLTLRERVVLAFVKLKMNLSFSAIEPLFSVSRNSCASYFKDIIPKLATILENVIPKPGQDDVRANMHLSFENYHNSKAVLDCGDTPVEMSKCLKCRLLTYSHFKKSNIVKFKIGVASSGLISSISKCYGGKSNEKLTTSQSHSFEKLDCLDSALADKRFFLTGEGLERNILQRQPPHKDQEYERAQGGAPKKALVMKARLNVERVMHRIKEFEFIGSKVAWNLLPYFDDSLIVACSIVNLSNPVLTIDKFI